MARAGIATTWARGSARGHPLGDRAELLVALAHGQRDRHRRARRAGPRAAPSRRCRARAGRRRGPAGVLRRRSAFAAAATRAGWPSHSGSAAHSRRERLDADRLDPVRERVVGARGAAARSAASASPGLAPTSTSRSSRSAERERRVQRDPAAHRVAREREALVRPARARRRCRRRTRRAGAAALAVAREVGRERASRAVERRDRPPPALPRLGEAVEEDERRGHRRG